MQAIGKPMRTLKSAKFVSLPIQSKVLDVDFQVTHHKEALAVN